MSKQYQFLQLLREKKTLTKEDLLGYAHNYIKALHLANYISIEKKAPRHGGIQSVTLIKEVGDKPIQYNRGMIYDFNTGEEIEISKMCKKYKKHTDQKILEFVLDAIISLNKEITTKQEIFQRADKLYPDKIARGNCLTRWIDKLIDAGAIVKTGEKYRNAHILKIKLEQVEKIRKKFNEIKNYNLLFVKA